MEFKFGGRITIEKTTKTTTTTNIKIGGSVETPTPGFPLSLPGRKPANGLPASGGKKPRVLAISSAPRGKAKK